MALQYQVGSDCSDGAHLYCDSFRWAFFMQSQRQVSDVGLYGNSSTITIVPTHITNTVTMVAV